jgi:hypothetical protein
MENQKTPGERERVPAYCISYVRAGDALIKETRSKGVGSARRTYEGVDVAISTT